MPDKINLLNLKVLVIDRDFYALQTLNSYLAWDRRTRVVALVNEVSQAIDYLQATAQAEWPDVIILEAEALADARSLQVTIHQFLDAIKDVAVICLGHEIDVQRAAAAAHAGARAYLLRNELKLRLVSAVCYALDQKFVVTASIQAAAAVPLEAQIYQASLLPPEREYPEMTERIRQAIWLCVVEGMPAHLAADEMGISPHTIRSYIKEGYRILEAHDDANYPEEMGPLERAFMRFTALEEEQVKKSKPPTRKKTPAP